MHNEVYADAVQEITVTGPIIRLDLVSMSPAAQRDSAPPAPAFRQRIIMPVTGFADAVGLMRKALDGLIEAGAVPDPADKPDLPVQAEAPLDGNRSPNFAAAYDRR